MNKTLYLLLLATLLVPTITGLEPGLYQETGTLPTATTLQNINTGEYLVLASANNNEADILGITDPTTIKEITFINNKANKELTTDTIYATATGFRAATIRLQKHAPTNTIIRCEDYNPNTDTCDEWTPTTIEYQETETYIEFTVHDFSAYAGTYAEIVSTKETKEEPIIKTAAITTINYTTGDNWTAPSNIEWAYIELWAGGGAGAGGAKSGGTDYGGGGGAGGQYVAKNITNLSAGTYEILVATATTGPAAGVSGDAGGNTSFNGTTVFAVGGAGGTAATTSSNGAGGVGTTSGGAGDTVFAGGNGTGGTTDSNGGAGGGGAGTTGAGGNASGSTAGTGTANFGGDGGAGSLSNNAAGDPASATGYGGGGGGGLSNGAGGAGGAGWARITYSANTAPTVTTDLAANATVDVYQNITYTITADDSEGDNYQLTVCSSPGIVDGSPGTCSGTTLCTSGLTADSSEATCDYAATDNEIPSLTAYGYVCDAGSESCSGPNSTTTTVNRVYGYLSVNINLPLDQSNVLQNDTFVINATVTCQGPANGVCGVVNATVRYNESAAVDTDINTSEGGSPFFLKSGVVAWQVWDVLDTTGYEAVGVAVDSGDNVYVTGRTSSYDYYTVKYTSAGVPVWNVTDANGYTAAGVAVDSGDNVYVTGSTSSSDYYTVKYTSAGVPVWNVTDATGSSAAGVAVDSGDNVYVTGTGDSTYYYTVKYNSAGDHVWNVTDGTARSGSGIAVDSPDGVHVTGGTADYDTVKYNSTGGLVWFKRDGTGRNAYDVAVDDSGDVYVTGTTGGPSGEYHTIKYNSTGGYVWNVTDPNGYQAYGVANDSQDNVYVTGVSQYNDYYTVKYDSVGVQVWNVTNSPGLVAYGVALDTQGNVYVTGTNFSGYYTVKYYQNNDNPQTSSSLSVGDSWNVLWLVNATGVNGSTYLVDVLFNSTDYPSNIAANDTEDRQVNITLSGDLTAPVISAVVNTSTTTSFTVNWSTTEDANSSVTWGEDTTLSNGTNTSASTTQTHSRTIYGLAQDTTYYYNITNCDASTNCNTAGPYSVTTDTLTISTVLNDTITNMSVNITWTTNYDANASIEYGETASLGTPGNNSATLESSHNLHLYGLDDDTRYYYNITSCDGTNCETAGPYNFTTLDSTAPTIENVTNDSITVASVNITWDTTEASNSSVAYGTTQALGTPGNTSADLVTSHSLHLYGLDTDQLYWYNVTSCDDSDNCATSGPYNFTTLPDSKAPAIENVSNDSITTTSVNITWDTTEASNSSVEYGETTSLGTLGNSSAAATTNHALHLHGLGESTQYFYNVTSCDAASNCNSSGPYTFTTLADSTDPTVSLSSPGDDTGDGDGDVTFTYTVNDDTGIENCSLYLDAAFDQVRDTGPFTTFTKNGLSAGSYDWYVTCTDNSSANNVGTSGTRTLTVVIVSGYSAKDLSSQNVSSVDDYYVSAATGAINWTSTIDFTNGADLTSYLLFGSGSVYLNSTNLTMLDGPANITFTGLSYGQLPEILQNGVPCGVACENRNYGAGTLRFNVSGFSNYSATSNSALNLSDDSDVDTVYVDYVLNFTANYSNVTDNSSINGSGIYCEFIEDSSGSWSTPVNMTFNDTTLLYEHNITATTQGTHTANVSCVGSAAGYEDINLSETFVINQLSGYWKENYTDTDVTGNYTSKLGATADWFYTYTQSDTRNFSVEGNNSPPTLSNVTLNATDNPLNRTDADLYAWPGTINDPDGDNVTLIYDWRIDGSSFAELNMPFEASTNAYNATDYSDNNHSSSALTGTPTYVPEAGVDGGGAYFFDADESVDINGSTWPTIGTGNYTFMAWIKTSSNYNYQAIFSFDQVNPAFYTDGDYLKVRDAGTATDRYSDANVNVTDGNWRFVAFVREGTGADQLKFYLDGQSLGSDQNPDSIPKPTTLHIGQAEFGGDGFDGYIDNVRFYTRALTPEQIAAYYDAGLPRHNITVAEETLYDETWSVCATPNDATEDGATKCSNDVTIENTPPTTPTLIAPTNNNYSVSSRYPTFDWSSSSDADSHTINYTWRLLEPVGCAAISDYEVVPSTYTSVDELCTDETYDWQVQACDEIGACSSWTSTWNFSIPSSVSINLTTNETNFGSMPASTQGSLTSNDTLDDDPGPMVVENIGNVNVNIDVRALDAMFSTEGLGTEYFQYADQDTANWVNMTASYTDFINNLLIGAVREFEINVTLPYQEPAGAKDSVIQFLAESAE